MNDQDEGFWADAAADAYTNLTRTTRVIPKATMLAIVDDVCRQGSMTQSELCERHRLDPDLIRTTIGHVTTAVHGPGQIPKESGWYRKVGQTYHVHPAFAEAWKARRPKVPKRF